MFSSSWSPPKHWYQTLCDANSRKDERNRKNMKRKRGEMNFQLAPEVSKLLEKGSVNHELIKESFDFNGDSFKEKVIESLIINPSMIEYTSELHNLNNEVLSFKKFQNRTSLIHLCEELNTEFREFVCEKGLRIFMTNSIPSSSTNFYTKFHWKCYASLDKYRYLPPIEHFLNVGPEICEQQFYKSVSAGDILFGKVIDYEDDTHILQIIATGGYHHKNLIGTNIKAELRWNDLMPLEKNVLLSDNFSLERKMCELNTLLTVEVLHTSNIMSGKTNSGKIISVGTKGVVLQTKYYDNVEKGSMRLHKVNKFVLGKVDTENNSNTFPSILNSIESNEVHSYDKCLMDLNLNIHSKSKHMKICRSLNFRYDYCQSLMNINFSFDEAETLRDAQSMKWVKEALDNQSICENKEYLNEIIESLNDGLKKDDFMNKGKADMIIDRTKLYKNLSRYKDALHTLKLLSDHHKMKKLMNVEVILEYARERESTQNFREAQKLYRKCLEIDPVNCEASESLDRMKQHNSIELKDQDIEELDKLLNLREDIENTVKEMTLQSLSSLEELLETGLVILEDEKNYKCTICDIMVLRTNIHSHLAGKNHEKKVKQICHGENDDSEHKLRDDVKKGLETGLLVGIPTTKQWAHEKSCWYHNFTTLGCEREAAVCEKEHHCSVCKKFSHGSKNCPQMWNLWLAKIADCTKLNLKYESLDEITEEDMREYFHHFGKVVNCEIPEMNSDVVSNFNTGFVEFEKSDAAEKALKQSGIHNIKGNVVHISKKPEEYKGSKLYVGSNSFANITESDMRECFSQFGKIVACNIPQKRDGGNYTFGFVEFEDEDATDKAAAETDILDIKGNVCVIYKVDKNYDERKRKQKDRKFGHYECSACKTHMTGMPPLIMHLDGDKHKGMVTKWKELESIEEELPNCIIEIRTGNYECGTCKIPLSGLASVHSHIKSGRHKKGIKTELQPSESLEVKKAIASGILKWNPKNNMYNCTSCESGDISTQSEAFKHMSGKKHKYVMNWINNKPKTKKTKGIIWASGVIYVSSIPLNATEADVIDFISAFGRIKNARLLLKSNQALFELFEKEEAEAIVADHTKENLKILGEDIEVDFSEHEVLDENPISRVLHFSNLPAKINNSRLIELASPYGEVTGVKILESHVRERGRKALVEMVNTDATMDLMNDLARIQDRQNIIVTYSEHKFLRSCHRPQGKGSKSFAEPLDSQGKFSGANTSPLVPRGNFSGANTTPLVPRGNFSGANTSPLVPQGNFSGANTVSNTPQGKFSGANTSPLVPRGNLSGAKTVSNAPQGKFSGANTSPLVPRGNLIGVKTVSNAAQGKFSGANTSPLVPRGNLSGAKTAPNAPQGKFSGANTSPLVPRETFSGANTAPVTNEIMFRHQLSKEKLGKIHSQPDYLIYGRREINDSKCNMSEYDQKPAISLNKSDPFYPQHTQPCSSNESMREPVQQGRIRQDRSTDKTHSLNLSSGSAEEIKTLLSSMSGEQKKMWEKRFDNHVKKMEQELEKAFADPSTKNKDDNFDTNPKFTENRKRKLLKEEQEETNVVDFPDDKSFDHQEIRSGSSSSRSRDSGTCYESKKQKILLEDEDSHDKSKYNMFARGLSIDRSKEEVMEFFSNYGVIEDVYLEWSNNPTFVGEQTAYIAFKRSQDVIKILSQHQNLFIKNSLISIHMYEDSSSSNNIVLHVTGITNVNRDTKRDLIDYFNMFGEVKTLFLNTNSRNSHYAFVTFNSKEDAKKIISKKEPYILHKDVLKLKEVKLLKEEKNLEKLEMTQQSICVPADRFSPLIKQSVNILKEIMQETGANYEFVLNHHTSINQTLTVHGTPEQIFSAKKLIKENLRTQMSSKLTGKEAGKDPPKMLIITENIYEVLEDICLKEVDLALDTCVRVLDNLTLPRLFNAVSIILNEMINVRYVILVFGIQDLTKNVNTSKGFYNVPKDDIVVMENFLKHSQEINEKLHNQFRGVKFLWTTPISYSFEKYNRQQMSIDRPQVIPAGCWRNIQSNFHKCLINLRMKMLQSDPHNTVDFLKLVLYSANYSDGLCGEQIFLEGEVSKEKWFTEDFNMKLNEEGGRALRYCIRKAVQRQILWGSDVEGKSEWHNYVGEMLYREEQERDHCRRDMQLLPLPNIEEIFQMYGAPVEQHSGMWPSDQRLPPRAPPVVGDEWINHGKRSWKSDRTSGSNERESHLYQPEQKYLYRK